MGRAADHQSGEAGRQACKDKPPPGPSAAAAQRWPSTHARRRTNSSAAPAPARRAGRASQPASAAACPLLLLSTWCSDSAPLSSACASCARSCFDAPSRPAKSRASRASFTLASCYRHSSNNTSPATGGSAPACAQQQRWRRHRPARAVSASCSQMFCGQAAPAAASTSRRRARRWRRQQQRRSDARAPSAVAALQPLLRAGMLLAQRVPPGRRGQAGVRLAAAAPARPAGCRAAPAGQAPRQ